MKHERSRRNFLRSGALAATALSGTGALSAIAQDYTMEGHATGIKLGLASYTFREFTRAQLIAYMKQLNLTALNAKDVKDHLPSDPAQEAAALADYVFWVPKVDELLSPIVNVVPLQLLAYHIADIDGKDVDQPRNLAKTVTVE